MPLPYRYCLQPHPQNAPRARDHSSETEMQNERLSLCEVPRFLVVGEVNEMFVCGICDGLLQEPRHASSCREHLFCRVCYEAALGKEACCPTCKQPVDASESLHGFGPFEAMVNSTVVRCPNSADARSGTGDKNSKEPATSRESDGSSARNLGSVQASGVEEEAEEGGSAGLRAGGAGGSKSSSSPFNGVHVGAPSNILESCPGPLRLDNPLLNLSLPALQVTYVDLVALGKNRGITSCSRSWGHRSKEELLQMLSPLYQNPRVKPHAPAPQPTPCPYGLNLFGHTGSRMRAAGGVGIRETKELWRRLGRVHV